MISCLEEEAKEIRKRAKLDQRTVSSYLLKLMMRWVEFEDRLFKQLSEYRPSARYVLSRKLDLPRGPRTAVLLRCSASEGSRVRATARRRGVTISGFIRTCLRRSWMAADARLRHSRFPDLTGPVPAPPHEEGATESRLGTERMKRV